VTNYSVVRLPLLESLYERLYRQNLSDRNQANWALRIFTERELSGLQNLQHNSGDSAQARLRLRHVRTGQNELTDEAYDLVVLATGYQSNTTCDLLSPLQPLLDAPAPGQYSVDRKYRLQFLPGKVSQDAGVWLQGWCENTHGVSYILQHICWFATNVQSTIAAERHSPLDSCRAWRRTS
jgi:L-ornithine N5-oxygenase